MVYQMPDHFSDLKLILVIILSMQKIVSLQAWFHMTLYTRVITFPCLAHSSA